MLTPPPPQSDVHLIKKGEKVGASEATLLQMLKIFPFSYGLIVKQGQHYYHTYTVDHVVDTTVLSDHHSYNTQCLVALPLEVPNEMLLNHTL